MKLKVMLAVLALAVAGWLLSCADVPSTGPDAPVFNSEFRFLNGAADLGSVSVAVDGASAGNLDFMGATSHGTYPSGSRLVTLSNGDTLRVAFTTDQRATVLILPLTGAQREFIKLIERRTFDQSATTGGRLRVVHGAVAPAVDVEVAGTDTTITLSSVGFRGSSGYLNVPSGSYTLTVFAAGDTNAIASTTVSAGNFRRTSVVVGDASAGSVAFVDLEDN